MTHYGIPAHRVTFESERVSVYVPHTDDGVYGVTECSTEDLETVSYRWDSPRLTTMLAVGASAAAASPAMGRKSLGTTNSLLAFANVRLGVWLPNPRFVAAMRAAKGPGAGDLLKRDPRSPARWLPYPRIRIGYLIKELFGLHDPTDLYVYVTDGGHWENTGLVDVLRGGVPAEVVCLDGSGNPVGRVTSIAEGIGLAHLECGLDVRLDLDPLREDPIKPRGQQYARRAVGLGVVLRPSSTTGTGRPQEAGLLWYVRPALTADTPSGILAFAERDANFPSTSTLDQFFDTEQFEAYRDLGRHVGYQVREARAHLLPALAAAQTLDDFRLAAADPAASWCLTALAALVGDEEYDVLRLRLPAS